MNVETLLAKGKSALTEEVVMGLLAQALRRRRAIARQAQNIADLLGSVVTVWILTARALAVGFKRNRPSESESDAAGIRSHQERSPSVRTPGTFS